MKNLSIAFLAAVSLMSFAGCKKKGGGGEAMAKMSEFKNQMCACTDKACTDKVAGDMQKWQADMAKEMGGKEPEKMNDEDMKKSAEISKAYADCQAKFAAPPPPPAPPAGDKPADPAAPPAGDKPADPAAPPAGDKPAAGSN